MALIKVSNPKLRRMSAARECTVANGDVDQLSRSS